MHKIWLKVCLRAKNHEEQNNFSATEEDIGAESLTNLFKKATESCNHLQSSFIHQNHLVVCVSKRHSSGLVGNCYGNWQCSFPHDIHSPYFPLFWEFRRRKWWIRISHLRMLILGSSLCQCSHVLIFLLLVESVDSEARESVSLFLGQCRGQGDKLMHKRKISCVSVLRQKALPQKGNQRKCSLELRALKSPWLIDKFSWALTTDSLQGAILCLGVNPEPCLRHWDHPMRRVVQ